MPEELIRFKKWNGEKIERPHFQFAKGDKPLVKFFNKDSKDCCDGRVSTIRTIYNSKDEFIGYYAIAMSQIDSSSLFDEKKVCTFPHPAIKLGRVLIDSRYRNKGKYDKKGYGTAVIKNIIHIAQQLNEKFIACRFITVDAKTGVVEFYKKAGFQEIKEKDGNKFKHLKKSILGILCKAKINTNTTVPMLFDLKD